MSKINELFESYSQEEWKSGAQELGLTVDDLQSKLKALLGPDLDYSKKPVVTSTPVISRFNCEDHIFEISLIGIVTIRLEVMVCPGPDFRIRAVLSIFILGARVETFNIDINRDNPKVCVTFSSFLTRLTLCLEVRNSCLFFHGEACVRGFPGFECAPFELQLLCF